MSRPPPFEPGPDRPAEIPLDEGQAVVEACVERIKHPRIRHCARNAFFNLRAAWRLHAIDSEMSLFRAITAEEEAAAALMLSLRQRGYPGAGRLNPRNHSHKMAFWPLLDAIARGFHEKGIPPPNLSIAKKGDPRIELSIDLASLAGLDQPLWARPDHPFNVVIHSDEKGPFEVHRWEKELLKIASDKGAEDIASHIAAEANIRNRILYASDEGIPAVRFEDDLLLIRLARVTWLLVVSIGILQTPKRQLLVVQGLESLLMALEKFEGDGFAFPAHERPAGPHLYLKEQAEGGMKLEVASEQP